VRDAEHLQVLEIRRPALRPGGHVVGVHFVEPVDARLVRIGPHRAQRAVGDVASLGLVGLLLVRLGLGLVVEQAQGEQLRLGLAAEYELVDALAVVDKRVAEQPFHAGLDLRGVVGGRVVQLVQPPPLQALHVLVRRTREDAGDPVDHRSEVGLQIGDAGIVAVLREIAVDGVALGGRDPVQRDGEDPLPLRVTGDVRLPLLHVRVVGVAVLLLRRGDEGSRVDRVEQLRNVGGDGYLRTGSVPQPGKDT
jgi:hypothetical protein